eukprot:14734346-Ditylum_brightwellii.AAC.1
MHGRNNTHDMDDCFELNRCKKRAKSDTSQSGKDKVSYKDLNIFVNAKVTASLNKAKKKQKKEKESSDEEGKLKESAPAADSDSNSNSNSEASCLLSDDSNINVSA